MARKGFQPKALVRCRFCSHVALTFLPSITIAVVILADLVSLANESYVDGRGKGPVLLALVSGHKYFALLKVVAFETFALVAFGYTLRLCELCRRFSNATATTVKQSQRRVWSAEEKQANVHEVSRVEKFFKIIWHAILRVLRLESEEEAVNQFQ